MSTHSPAFTAILFGLSGCLVDFGARTIALTLQHLCPKTKHPRDLEQALGHTPTSNELEHYQRVLCEFARDQVELTPSTAQLLDSLHQQHIPCAWLDELPAEACQHLTSALPSWLKGTTLQHQRPWPAPDAIWESLMALKAERLNGCVLVSGEPRLLQAGLNAGIWTIGLAISGPLCGMAIADWQSQTTRERDQLRSQATLSLYRLGAHSVIDQLSDLPTCRQDISLRQQKGERP
jgi:beta-phosphoglucomutase-like phosphatase (HAD superfamily)